MMKSRFRDPTSKPRFRAAPILDFELLSGRGKKKITKLDPNKEHWPTTHYMNLLIEPLSKARVR